MKKRVAKKKKEKLKDRVKNSVFVQSFKLNKSFFYTLLLDIVHYIVLFLIFIIINRLMLPHLSSMQQALPMIQNINALTAEEISQQILPLNAVLVKIQFYILLLFVLFLVNWTFFKGVIWNVIRKRRLFSLNHHLKLLGFNAAYFIAFIIIFYMLFRTLRQDAFSYVILFIVIPLFIYLGIIFYAVLEKKLFASLKKTGRIMLRPFNFIIPVLLILALSYILLIIVSLLSFLPAVLYIIIVLLIFLAFIAWARFYLASIIHNIEKNI